MVPPLILKTIMTEKVSIGIVGGGPVGLYLALKLSAKENYQVTLFEKKDWPVDKVCGQGIMPSGRERLNELGIEFQLDEAFEFSGIEYHSGTRSLKGTLSSPGIGVERSVLSNKLYSNIVHKKNVQLMPKHRVSDIDVLSKKKIKITANETEFVFDYLFCCDGLHSKTRDLLHETRQRTESLRMGARVHYNISPWEKSVLVYWNKGVEAYVTPVSKSKIEVAFLWFESAFEKGPRLEERLADIFPDLHSKLDPVKKINDFKAYGPFNKFSNTIEKGNIFFVGDAYCFKDGITGEGISLGFKSADIFAASFTDFKLIHKTHIYMLYLNYRFWISLALILSKHTKLREFTFVTFHKFRYLFNRCLDLNDNSFKFLKRFY